MASSSYKVNEGFDGVHETREYRGTHREEKFEDKDKPEGCFVRSSTGFCMVFLALAAIAMVAVVVYFATGNRDIVCNCPSVTQAGGSNSGQNVQCPSATPCPACTCK